MLRVPKGVARLPRGQEANNESTERGMGKLLLPMERLAARGSASAQSNAQTKVWFSQHADLACHEGASTLALVGHDAVKLIRLKK